MNKQDQIFIYWEDYGEPPDKVKNQENNDKNKETSK